MDNKEKILTDKNIMSIRQTNIQKEKRADKKKKVISIRHKNYS